VNLPPELRWRATGDVYFPYAALVDDRWHVLRLNSFPDHPLYTVFVDGRALTDVEDFSPGWLHPASDDPRLPLEQAALALLTVRGLVAYGSEHGTPCDNPFCCG